MMKKYLCKKLFAVRYGAFAILLAITCKGWAVSQPLDSVAAIVNNQVITQSQLTRQIAIAKQQMLAARVTVPPPATMRQQVLNHMIDTQLQLQVAKKSGIKVSDAQLDHTIALIAARNGMTASQLQQQIARHGLNVANYREEIRKEIIISQLQQQQVAPQIVIKPQEVKDALREVRALPVQPPARPTLQNLHTQYHLLDILISVPNNPVAGDFTHAQREAQKVLTQLKNGVNPQSIDNASASIQLNDLGWRPLSQLPTVFVQAAESLVPGEYSSPIRAANGYHILQLLDVHGLPAVPPVASSPGLLQAKVNVLMVKKTPLMTTAQLQARMNFLRQQIVATQNFASIAEKNSQDPTTASKGGAMGWVGPGELPPQVDAVIGQLAQGEISQPIETASAYYIIQVTGKREIYDKKQLQQDEARQLVYQRKYAQALQQWLQTLRNESYIKIM